MPTVANAADDRGCDDCWRHDDGGPGHDHDRPSIRLTSSVEPAVPSRATSALSTSVRDKGK